MHDDGTALTPQARVRYNPPDESGNPRLSPQQVAALEAAAARGVASLDDAAAELSAKASDDKTGFAILTAAADLTRQLEDPNAPTPEERFEALRRKALAAPAPSDDAQSETAPDIERGARITSTAGGVINVEVRGMQGNVSEAFKRKWLGEQGGYTEAACAYCKTKDGRQERKFSGSTPEAVEVMVKRHFDERHPGVSPKAEPIDAGGKDYSALASNLPKPARRADSGRRRAQAGGMRARGSLPPAVRIVSR